MRLTYEITASGVNSLCCSKSLYSWRKKGIYPLQSHTTNSAIASPANTSVVLITNYFDLSAVWKEIWLLDTPHLLQQWRGRCRAPELINMSPSPPQHVLWSANYSQVTNHFNNISSQRNKCKIRKAATYAMHKHVIPEGWRNFDTSITPLLHARYLRFYRRKVMIC